LVAVTVQIRLFAILREHAGRQTLQIELHDGATVADALRELDDSGPLAGLIERLSVSMSVNRVYATKDTPLRPGDELALIPPLSGGEATLPAQIHVRVTDQDLSMDALHRRVSSPHAGAIVIFCGVTREVERLEYEAYVEMADEQIAAIAAECARRNALSAIAIEHRVGSVPLQQPSVIVAASAPHREQAFAGAREAIDLVKERAPIWKREIAGESGRWVQGTPPR
jgi:MoaE-MoaD fusion protein